MGSILYQMQRHMRRCNADADADDGYTLLTR
jgi:hypothetical protein